ncbi:MAG: NAD(P)/FAD-dependent oxidoreductase [Acidimicrobiales bacterium]
MRSGYDVVVVGGGLVGTSLAYELACRGAAVALLDRADPGRASDAGAGILSPETTWRTDAVWFPFAAEAGAHYPGLVERLAGDGAPDPGYARTGLLSVSLSEGDEPWFENLARHALERAPDDVAEVPVTEARARLPVLGHLRRALFNRAAARIDGRALTASLRHGCGARGVEVLAAGALGLDTSGDRATGVRTAEGAVAADAVVVAAGAWTPAVAEWLSVSLPVRPVKGQIVHLRVDDPARDPGNWPIAQPVLGHYLVPWPDRRVACGGTFEDRQAFDPRPTAAGTHELLRECLKLAPGLAEAALIEVRVGFRPCTPDDLPLLGPVPGWRNVHVDTGHGAEGLLAGPYSGAVVAAEVLGDERSLTAAARRALEAFSPGRLPA